MKDNTSGEVSDPRYLDEAYALERAYVPEHIPGLMSLISKGEPFLVGEYPGYARRNWLILVGYPLKGQFTKAGCEQAVTRACACYHPDYLWFIGPEAPAFLQEGCQDSSADDYYLLNLDKFKLKSNLRRAVACASASLTVEREQVFEKEHRRLVDEFLRLRTLPPMVAGLYRSMSDYLASSNSAIVLSARDRRGRLSALYVVEQAARAFDAYLLGCYSRKNYVPYASDLLFQAMIELAREHGKRIINLGLGVNDGIRRFKQKWGGVPSLKYEFRECYYGPPKTFSMFDLLMEGDL